MLKMKAHFLDKKYSISAIAFLATFKLACNSNRNHEDVALWGLSHYVNETLANALNSHMYAEEKFTPIVSSVHNNDSRSRKLLRLYSEAGNYFLKKFGKDQAIT